MKRILTFVILSALLAISGFYIKYLHSENNRLEGLEDAYTRQITEITNRAEEFEKISQDREQKIQVLNKKQEDFQYGIEKAKNNEDFKNWFDSPLPSHVLGLFKENARD